MTKTDTRKTGLARAALGALGVVYGDIGTSPIYALRESFSAGVGLVPDTQSVLGVLSLAFWILTLIVTIEYVGFVLRADNRGEGGLLSLAALAAKTFPQGCKRAGVIAFLAICGLALVYGDGLITPSISVLSAVEGLKIITPAFEPYVVPIVVGILLGLFAIQFRGTAKVGGLFGPIIFVWFATLGVLGLNQVIAHPEILRAVDPRYAFALIHQMGPGVFILLGAVVLTVTGAEALYADLGHFGRKPIRLTWVFLVFPSLILNYFGQGALVLADPTALAHPFFHLAPDWFLIPLVILATLATIIASQALITAVFSMTRQAIQLGYLPRMTIKHTSEHERGQIYLPRMNWLLCAGVLVLVVGFGSSSNLAHAYGIAVTGAMMITTTLAMIVAARHWKWKTWQAVGLFSLFLTIDVSLFTACAMKVPDGGWFPLLLAGGIVFTILTWRRGQALVYNRLYRDAMPLALFLDQLKRRPQQRVPGTAIFLTGNLTTVPNSLLHNLKHNKVLHERIILLNIVTEEEPFIAEEGRLSLAEVGEGFYTLLLRFGFMETQNVPRALTLCAARGAAIDLMQTSFFLGRKTLIPSARPDLNAIEERLYITLAASATSAPRFYAIPPNRAVELGTLIEI